MTYLLLIQNKLRLFFPREENLQSRKFSTRGETKSTSDYYYQKSCDTFPNYCSLQLERLCKLRKKKTKTPDNEAKQATSMNERAYAKFSVPPPYFTKLRRLQYNKQT